MGRYVGVSRVPDIIVQMSETYFWSHVILNIQDGVDDVSGDKVTGA